MKVDSINSIIFEVSRSQNNIRNIIIVVDKRCNEGVVHSFMPLLNNEQQYFNLYPHTLSETVVTSYRSFPREMDLNCFAFFILNWKRSSRINFTFLLHSQEQQNGCNNKTADAFIFTEARDSDSGYFTYTQNSRCLGTNIDGSLSLMTISDTNTKKCSFKHIKWPLLRWKNMYSQIRCWFKTVA